MSSNEIIKGGSDYIGYDYKTVTTNSEQVSFCLDAYENFGWMPDDSISVSQQTDSVTLRLKRDRKILNKAELTRLQQHFEACMDEIATLENTKARTAIIYSLTVGLIGTAFIAGSVFAVTNDPPMILLCVLLGIPGVIGWVASYPLFKYIVQKRAAEITPLIEQKYDDVHDICAKGNTLVHK